MFGMMTVALLAMSQPSAITPERVAALERRVADLEARLMVADQQTPAAPARLFAVAAEREAAVSVASSVSYTSTAASCTTASCGTTQRVGRSGPLHRFLGRFR